MYSRLRLTFLYFIPLFLIILIFAGGMFWYVSSRITNIDTVLREISHTTRSISLEIPDNTNPIRDYDPEKVSKIISDDDWKKLSMKEIDDKLRSHGITPIGNNKSPTYAIRSSDISKVISESDWKNLSMKEIDNKLASSGIPAIGDKDDPTYNMKPNDIDGQYINMSYISAKQLENLKNTMSLQLLFSIFGGFVLVMFAFLGLSYFFALRSVKPLEQALKKQKQFVSDASHELRTPLSLIRSGAEILLRDKNARIEDYREFATCTIEDTDYLSGLTTSLLALTKIEHSSDYQNTNDKIELSSFIANICDKFTPALQLKKLHLHNHAQNEIYITTEPTLLREVLSILIDNAIKYTPSGEINIDTKKEKNTIRISVSDTGIGIEKKHLPKIFDRFYRASADRNEKGYGLGLSIAKQASEKLSGSLSVESTLGKGTTFYLILPL